MSKPVYFFLLALSWFGSFFVASKVFGEGSTLAALERVPMHTSDRAEVPEDRRKRLAEIATAIDEATASKDERALLVALGQHESHFAAVVGSGERLGDRSKAYGYFQSWEKDRGGGVTGQVDRAIKHLRRAGNHCGGEGAERARGSFSLYATGKTCSWPGAPSRVVTWQRVLGRL